MSAADNFVMFHRAACVAVGVHVAFGSAAVAGIRVGHIGEYGRGVAVVETHPQASTRVGIDTKPLRIEPL